MGPLLATSLLGLVLAQPAVGHWPFDEGTGSTTADTTGHGHTQGTPRERPAVGAWQVSRRRACIRWRQRRPASREDPAFDNLPVKTVAAFVRVGRARRSLAALYRRKGNREAGWGWQFSVESDGSVRFHQCFDMDGQWSTEAGMIVPGSWTHVAVVYDRTSLSNLPLIYVNGVEATMKLIEVPAGMEADESAFDIGIGANAVDNAENFAGAIDDVWIFDLRTFGQRDRRALRLRRGCCDGCGRDGRRCAGRRCAGRRCAGRRQWRAPDASECVLLVHRDDG